MTVKPNPSTAKTESPMPRRVSLSGERLHFVSPREKGMRMSPRLHLTRGLVR